MMLDYLFIDIGDISKGSARIYGRNISRILKEYGFLADFILFDNIGDVDFSVLPKSRFVLLGKGMPNVGKGVFSHASLRLGRLHPDLNKAGHWSSDYDFFIVGSVSERLAVLNKAAVSVILVPQIEFLLGGHYSDNFMCDTGGIASSTAKILWHGDSGHLYNFPSDLVDALNDFGNKIEFVVVTNKKVGIKGLHVEPRFVNYSEENLLNELTDTRVGLVTSVNRINTARDFISNRRRQKQKGDIIVRYKWNSNPARAFLFVQHGINFLCDINPEHYIFNRGIKSPLCDGFKAWRDKLQECIEGRVIQDFDDIFKRYHDYSELIDLMKDESDRT